MQLIWDYSIWEFDAIRYIVHPVVLAVLEKYQYQYQDQDFETFQYQCASGRQQKWVIGVVETASLLIRANSRTDHSTTSFIEQLT